MKQFCLLIIAIFLTATLTMTVLAHPGKTDANGGHTDHSTGEYHYHHGYSAHQHWDMDGDGDLDCPYEFEVNTENSNENSASQRKENHLPGFVLEILKFIGFIGIGYAFYGAFFLKLKIEDALDYRRFKKGKKKTHTLPWVLLSLLFISVSVGAIVFFFMNEPQINISAISAPNLIDTIIQILTFGICFVPVAVSILFVVIIFIFEMWSKIPEDDKPHIALLKAAAVNAVLATAIICLILIAEPLLQ